MSCYQQVIAIILISRQNFNPNPSQIALVNYLCSLNVPTEDIAGEILFLIDWEILLVEIGKLGQFTPEQIREAYKLLREGKSIYEIIDALKAVKGTSAKPKVKPGP